MHRHTIHLFSAIAIGAMALTACGPVKESIGVFTGDRREVALVLDLGYATVEDLVAAAKPTIDTAAAQGGTLRAFVVTSGSAGSLTPIRFSNAAGGGNFTPEGRNRRAWDEEASVFADAAADDVRAVLGSLAPSPTGRDLVGGVNRAIEALADSDTATRQVVLVSGGGVQQTAMVDLVATPVTPANAAELAAAAPIDLTEGVTLVVVGAARFSGVEPPPDGEFVNGVEAYWRAQCAPHAASCRVVTFGEQG